MRASVAQRAWWPHPVECREALMFLGLKVLSSSGSKYSHKKNTQTPAPPERLGYWIVDRC